MATQIEKRQIEVSKSRRTKYLIRPCFKHRSGSISRLSWPKLFNWIFRYDYEIVRARKEIYISWRTKTILLFQDWADRFPTLQLWDVMPVIYNPAGENILKERIIKRTNGIM